jgi:hypothetical protein
MWTAIIILFALLGIVFVILESVFHIPQLINPGIILFSISGVMIGIESVIKRKIILPSSHNKRLSETYLGVAAIAQGLIIIFLGCFLISLVILDYLKFDKSIFIYLVKHPGIALLFFSLMCFLSAIIAFVGSREEKEIDKFVFILNLLTIRLLGGLILIAIGILSLFLGIIEISNPEYFDSLGGGFIEVLFLGAKGK